MKELLENPLFNICGLVGFIFGVTGFIMYQFPPKKINFLYGYRTAQSMASQERWDFAQKYSAKELMKSALFLVLLSLLAMVREFPSSVYLVMGLASVFLLVALLFIRVENAVRRKFGKLDT